MSAEEAQYFQELIQSRMSRQCRTELEEAMGGNTHDNISEKCKEEVTQIYHSLTTTAQDPADDVTGGGHQQSGRGYPEGQQSAAGGDSSNNEPLVIEKKPWFSAQNAIMLFVVMTVIGISSFCYMHKDMIMAPKKDDRSNSQKRKDQKGRR